MKVITNIPECSSKKRIVIIGGGFAGLHIAKKIDSRYYQTVLIDKVNFYQFQPLLYQVASGGLDPSSISYPHRKTFQQKKDFHYRMCVAQRVKPEEKTIETNIGYLKYDYLVIATGCDTNYFGNDKLKDTTYPLKSVSESLLARNRILLSFEDALNAKDEDELKEILNFVIVGGGATGVELAGALADMKKSILPKDYPELDFSKMEIHLVDASPRLLSGMSPEASAAAADTLSKRGVIIHQNTPVKDYVYPYVELGTGGKIRSRNVFWVSGVKANSLKGLAEEAYGRGGRLAVDEYNRVEGYENIFAIGDTSLMVSQASPKGHAQVAQVALQMAACLAKNLNEQAQDNEKWRKFRYSDKGSMATIGRNAAVVDFGKFHMKGRIAWWLWLLVHILSIVGMRNKMAVFIDWVWNYLNYDVSLRLLIRPKHNPMYQGMDNNTPVE
ncbi:NADH dehydrogenase [Dysgonomonas sp. PH5-45]|uniref:NAD(P)/FAD-dependent oxidoreductase n=1 Tax=unclassified Dysgonomonas TaxID=2630389 RepID=UPI0024750483|nr:MULTISPECIES: NAD(P)/FAD-dependent oxidoreductase [unclassified Dysgonomonas]MDH6354266.1 NADH dehydrogenase [Dysgonomonas sp. PH5-45]MDH6387167.1 NADH dehydrogenase [Dysgonomonas sp. PH5-37]